MPPKAIATHSIFLIATMALFLVFTLISLWFWLGQTPVDANKATCTAKYLNYCERWSLNDEDPGDWGEIYPKNCEEFDIDKPMDLDDCKNIN